MSGWCLPPNTKYPIFTRMVLIFCHHAHGPPHNYMDSLMFTHNALHSQNWSLNTSYMSAAQNMYFRLTSQALGRLPKMLSYRPQHRTHREPNMYHVCNYVEGVYIVVKGWKQEQGSDVLYTRDIHSHRKNQIQCVSFHLYILKAHGQTSQSIM